MDYFDANRMYSSTFFASTSSGTLPPSTTVSLNAFRSNFAPERRLRLLALPVDLAVPDLVAARLPGPRAIAIDFAGHFQRIRSVHVDEELHALLARPALGVDAGVDDQPAGAEGDRLQVAEPPDRIVLVRAELVGELLGVERPPFRVGVEGEQLADQRHLVRVFALPDVAGNRFVEGQVGEAVLAVQVGRPEVDPEPAGDLAVDRSGAAVRAGRAGLLLGRQPLHFHVRIDDAC